MNSYEFKVVYARIATRWFRSRVLPGVGSSQGDRVLKVVKRAVFRSLSLENEDET